MEEDGRRWKKMEEKKSSKIVGKNVFFFCLESAGDGLGTLIGVQRAPKNIIGTRLPLFRKKSCHNLTVVLRIDSYESN